MKSSPARRHSIVLNERILEPEDGLILGNGDLSVSVYQTSDRIIWRFGKGDVWDRRLDLTDDPRPAHIDEVARGIRDEGWKCGPYGGPVEATRGTSDPDRMRQICQGCPPSYERRPYPCPKPVGELAMHLPPDLMGLKIRQRLDIERATLTIQCTWPAGVKVAIECFIHPRLNVLVIRWRIDHWTDQVRYGDPPPIRFSLYRWADPRMEDFKTRYFGDYRHGLAAAADDPKVTPLPPPTIRQSDGYAFIEQTFFPDPEFREGFRCLLAPFVSEGKIEPMAPAGMGEARFHLLTVGVGGWVAVAVATSRDHGGPYEQIRDIRGELLGSGETTLEQWRRENGRAAKEFWARSSFRTDDRLLEDLWYQTLHIRRCAYRADTIPPGLFLPGTVKDYSHWHGDYHTNYNFQSPFWGDYTANHLELGDAFFQAMKYLIHMGRKIAKDHYGARGYFIQLSGYPILAEDDCLGCVPMGRMAYMTGWMAHHYWWRYRYTMDVDWLREIGYLGLKGAALFYTDFLKKGDDGLYHAFPSNQGEDGFSGDAKDYTDRAQIIRHVRYLLRVTLEAARVLGTDKDLQSVWQDILTHMAPEEGSIDRHRETYRSDRDGWFPPEFMSHDGDRRVKLDPGVPSFWANPASEYWRWYCGKVPWLWMVQMRNESFVPARDLPHLRRYIERWRHPNGMLWGMGISHYGHGGAWTETLGIIGPLQEMMLQSWDGVIRVFPAWPENVPARFEQFRAEGAFLVTAAWKNGRVESLRIKSLAGQTCRLANPWPGATVHVVGAKMQKVESERKADRIVFATETGKEYRIESS